MNSEKFEEYIGKEFDGMKPPTVEELVSVKLPDFQPFQSLNKKIRAYSDCMADLRERIYGMPYQREMRGNFLMQLEQELVQSNDILDAGCGTGLDVCFLQMQYPEKRFFAYDISHKNIRRARARAERLQLPVRFIVAEHDALPFAQEIFDLMYINEALLEEEPFLDTTRFIQMFFERFGTLCTYLRSHGIMATTHAFPAEGTDTLHFWHLYAAEQAGMRHLEHTIIYEPDERSNYFGCAMNKFEKTS
ncbi:MAG: class I SAM-dependent methyltransferase [Planctomycetes bacterium]|nr:class I SAM-dependent methyltransferase [Planctomycetota bacterium]